MEALATPASDRAPLRRRRSLRDRVTNIRANASAPDIDARSAGNQRSTRPPSGSAHRWSGKARHFSAFDPTVAIPSAFSDFPGKAQRQPEGIYLHGPRGHTESERRIGEIQQVREDEEHSKTQRQSARAGKSDTSPAAHRAPKQNRNQQCGLPQLQRQVSACPWAAARSLARSR